MHIPDGYLNGQTCWLTNLVSGGIILGALSKIKDIKDNQKIVYYSLMGALIFALQMLNFPIGNGASGHFLGGTLAYLVAGPWLGSLMISMVLAIQAFFFNDGGIFALGANILAMGIVGVWVPFFLKKAFPKLNKYLGVALASWTSVVAAAFTCSVLLAISGTVALNQVLGAMLGAHAIIGVGEVFITFGAYVIFVENQALLKINLWAQQKSVLVSLVLTIIILAVCVSPFASSFPDGLEKVLQI